jgi:hypothetical protein
VVAVVAAARRQQQVQHLPVVVAVAADTLGSISLSHHSRSTHTTLVPVAPVDLAQTAILEPKQISRLVGLLRLLDPAVPVGQWRLDLRQPPRRLHWVDQER